MKLSIEGRLVARQLIENMKMNSTCRVLHTYCDYCIDILQSGIEYHYHEVFELLAMETEISKKTTLEVLEVLEMYNTIEQLLKRNERLFYQYKKYLFTGFLEPECEIYYLFLYKHNQTTVSLEDGPKKSLKYYKKLLNRFRQSSVYHIDQIEQLDIIFDEKRDTKCVSN